jgi:plastocyanin
MTARVGFAVLVAATTLVASGGAASTADVAMPGKFFAPADLDVLVGTTVTWRNTDRGTHTVTEDEDAFDSGHIRPGGTFSQTFAESGTFRFHCTIHRFMRGSVSVYEVVLLGPHEPLPAGRRAHLEGVAPSGATLVVLERVLPGPVEVVRRLRPDAEGRFSTAVFAPEPRRYRVRAGKASSPVVRVRVAPRVSAERIAGGIAVRALPARPGSRVAIQAYDREHFAWVTVARGRLDGRSRATVGYEPIGRRHVRAVVVGREGWSNGVSRPLVVEPTGS